MWATVRAVVGVLLAHQAVQQGGGERVGVQPEGRGRPAANAGAVPADWAHRVATGEMLYIEDDSKIPGFKPGSVWGRQAQVRTATQTLRPTVSFTAVFRNRLTPPHYSPRL